MCAFDGASFTFKFPLWMACKQFPFKAACNEPTGCDRIGVNFPSDQLGPLNTLIKTWRQTVVDPPSRDSIEVRNGWLNCLYNLIPFDMTEDQRRAQVSTYYCVKHYFAAFRVIKNTFHNNSYNLHAKHRFHKVCFDKSLITLTIASRYYFSWWKYFAV